MGKCLTRARHSATFALPSIPSHTCVQFFFSRLPPHTHTHEYVGSRWTNRNLFVLHAYVRIDRLLGTCANKKGKKKSSPAPISKHMNKESLSKKQEPNLPMKSRATISTRDARERVSLLMPLPDTCDEREYLCSCPYLRICTHIHTIHLCTCKHTYVYTYIQAYTSYVHLYTFIYVHISTPYIRLYIHTCIRSGDEGEAYLLVILFFFFRVRRWGRDVFADTLANCTAV